MPFRSEIKTESSILLRENIQIFMSENQNNHNKSFSSEKEKKRSKNPKKNKSVFIINFRK